MKFYLLLIITCFSLNLFSQNARIETASNKSFSEKLKKWNYGQQGLHSNIDSSFVVVPDFKYRFYKNNDSVFTQVDIEKNVSRIIYVGRHFNHFSDWGKEHYLHTEKNVILDHARDTNYIAINNMYICKSSTALNKSDTYYKHLPAIILHSDNNYIIKNNKTFKIYNSNKLKSKLAKIINADLCLLKKDDISFYEFNKSINTDFYYNILHQFSGSKLKENPIDKSKEVILKKIYTSPNSLNQIDTTNVVFEYDNHKIYSYNNSYYIKKDNEKKINLNKSHTYSDYDESSTSLIIKGDKLYILTNKPEYKYDEWGEPIFIKNIEETKIIDINTKEEVIKFPFYAIVFDSSLVNFKGKQSDIYDLNGNLQYSNILDFNKKHLCFIYGLDSIKEYSEHYYSTFKGSEIGYLSKKEDIFYNKWSLPLSKYLIPNTYNKLINSTLSYENNTLYFKIKTNPETPEYMFPVTEFKNVLIPYSFDRYNGFNTGEVVVNSDNLDSHKQGYEKINDSIIIYHNSLPQVIEELQLYDDEWGEPMYNELTGEAIVEYYIEPSFKKSGIYNLNQNKWELEPSYSQIIYNGSGYTTILKQDIKTDSIIPTTNETGVIHHDQSVNVEYNFYEKNLNHLFSEKALAYYNDIYKIKPELTKYFFSEINYNKFNSEKTTLSNGELNAEFYLAKQKDGYTFVDGNNPLRHQTPNNTELITQFGDSYLFINNDSLFIGNKFIKKENITINLYRTNTPGYDWFYQVIDNDKEVYDMEYFILKDHEEPDENPFTENDYGLIELFQTITISSNEIHIHFNKEQNQSPVFDEEWGDDMYDEMTGEPIYNYELIYYNQDFLWQKKDSVWHPVLNKAEIIKFPFGYYVCEPFKIESKYDHKINGHDLELVNYNKSNGYFVNNNLIKLTDLPNAIIKKIYRRDSGIIIEYYKNNPIINEVESCFISNSGKLLAKGFDYYETINGKLTAYKIDEYGDIINSSILEKTIE